ncbi:hybrid sensor histidine kinase/response regulator [Bacteroides helcogenes]|uniref:histidine kinase n=1 Tax=Bacteroides helcogenes (strain ATCC 35417 / DSM 20613 / JCM 6297 / CCUG 15421 / P 36-108) TaxID=693979 RepID=E6SS39_BACT6|nr:hybrid sensor histidine kinase/response regulator [Bacteroides helcogenes]ADV43141.1 multi-sensor hybrid histidine kinase [Bacteroides helcogenes P 36-108]MDY5239119.1 hybrid sensor histidine kinase/response regulator [Bacteroides helcogenes]
MNSVSKVKIAAGYTLLLAVMFSSLFFVHREMENLMLSDDRDIQWTDSLLTLLREKDTNTIRMLRTLSEANDSMVSTSDIEHIIAQQDSAVARQRVQHRIITHRDTVVTRPKKKGFFRRLGEVFAPPKKDTAIQVKTSLEFATDTVIAPYNPADSLHEKLRAVTQQKKAVNTVVQRRKLRLQRLDHVLTARIDSLLKDYETETLSRARQEAEYQQTVRHRSARIIGGIAVGALLLSAFFLIVIGRDVTRSNRYRRELEEARHRAENLLATREKLMLAITHDFKAPLGSIMGYADLLSRLTVDERQRFYLDNMKTSSEHLLKLVVDLLDFHRLDLHKAEVNRVSFYPFRLLEEICVSFEPLTSAKGLTLKYEFAPELNSTFISDPLRLRQIINNLFSNAVKFTDQGCITMAARYENRRLVVSIADTGKGMEPADRERIFQEFTRLPGAQGKEGFGLGLSIVRMLVQLLEGTIEVDSAPGKGSTFTLSVPIYPVRRGDDEEMNGRNEGPDYAAVPHGNSSLKKVLLIDDDRIQLTFTSAMLSQNGIASVSCLQVDELLDALRTETFDVLLSDVQMPAINGFDLLDLLRASNIPQARSIPVVAVTARSDMKREEFTEHGFAGCLHKPFSIRDLFREVGGDYDFAMLTAFAEDDSEAAEAIMESFVSETRLNADRLRKAIEACDMSEIAAVSHKMLPVFTLLKAVELTALLRELEESRDLPFAEPVCRKAQAALSCIEDLLKMAAARHS